MRPCSASSPPIPTPATTASSGWATRAPMPVAAWTYQPGIGYAVTDDGPLSLEGRYPGTPSGVEQEVADALRADGRRLHAARRTTARPVRHPVRRRAARRRVQRHHQQPASGAGGSRRRARRPTRSRLTAHTAAELSRLREHRLHAHPSHAHAVRRRGEQAGRRRGGGAGRPARLHPVGGRLAGERATPPAISSAGTLHVAVPYDPDWHLTVDGEDVAGRRAFGSTLAFDAPTAGPATLAYDTLPVAPAVGDRCSCWSLVALLDRGEPGQVVAAGAASSAARCSPTRRRWPTSPLRSTRPSCRRSCSDDHALHFIDEDEEPS